MSRTRIDTYVALVKAFSSRSVFFHAAVAEKLKLHVTDLKSLHLLGDAAMTAGALGQEIGLSGPSVTALIDRLERAGYVVRERSSPDRRQILVRVLPERMREVDQLYEDQYARMSELLSSYSAEEFRAIADFLERTSAVLAEETRRLKAPSKAE